jgi:TonB family protein
VLQFQVGHSESCRPALANREEISDLLAAAGAQAQASGSVVLRLWVTEAGNVGDIRVVRSSGNQNVDGLATAVAHRMRFRPASNDYVPVAVWVQMPVSISAR